ncbi:MAG: DsrE family protein [Verrucomicrobia bacterium]|nr:DsrE family protein [Verrucomicrobiota bacterium]
MSLRGKKLGLLISTRPDHPNFERGLKLAEAALSAGITVYLYCIDEAVFGVGDPRLHALEAQGLHLYACAFAARRRELLLDDRVTYAGLSVVNDMISATDRFVSFN